MAIDAHDIRLDENDDMVAINGDMVAVVSDAQHMKDIIDSNLGEWKESPLLGVGIRNDLNSSGRKQQLKRSIREQAEGDNYNVQRLEVFDNLEVEINADRIR